jgi:hypothetical protein
MGPTQPPPSRVLGALKPLRCDADPPPPHMSLWRVQSSFTSASFSMFNDVPCRVEEEHEVWDWPCIAQKYGRSAILKPRINGRRVFLAT